MNLGNVFTRQPQDRISAQLIKHIVGPEEEAEHRANTKSVSDSEQTKIMITCAALRQIIAPF